MRFAALIFMAMACLPTHAPAQNQGFLNGVGVEQRLGESIPLNVSFRDETGRPVLLSELIRDRPVLLTPVYYQCPMLCTITLNQLARSLNVMSEAAGKEFDIITFSFDPRETAELAAAKKASYLKSYARPSAAQGWHFLTGSQESIDRLTQAMGFAFHWDEPSQSFVHASSVVVLTPTGMISRYFLGVDYPATELQQALRQAGGGSVGHPAEAVFLYCFRYDASRGRYSLIINRALRVLGIATFVALVGLIGASVVRERRRLSRQAGQIGGEL